MRSLLALLLASGLSAQLPAPVFPPITTAFPVSNLCGQTQPAWPFSLDIQTNRTHTDVQASGVHVGQWVTHETSCETRPDGSYFVVLLVHIVPVTDPVCAVQHLMPLMQVPGGAVGHDLLWLPSGISTGPTHLEWVGLAPLTYFLGYQIPFSGHDSWVIYQWARLDPNGTFYLSNLSGYRIFWP